MRANLLIAAFAVFVSGCAASSSSPYPKMYSEGPWQCRVDNGHFIEYVPYGGTPETMAYRGNLYCKYLTKEAPHGTAE